MNLFRATSIYQSFRDITNTPEGSETHSEKSLIAFGVKWHLCFRSALGALGASHLQGQACTPAVPWEGVDHHGRSLPSHPLHGAVWWPKSITSDKAVLGLPAPGLSRGAATKPPGCWGWGGESVSHAILGAFF